MPKKTEWKTVITIALRIERYTGKFIPKRGYSAEEISNYLLCTHLSDLREEEKQILRSLRGD